MGGSDNFCAISGTTYLNNRYHFPLHFCLEASDFLINGKEEDIRFWLRQEIDQDDGEGVAENLNASAAGENQIGENEEDSDGDNKKKPGTDGNVIPLHVEGQGQQLNSHLTDLYVSAEDGQFPWPSNKILKGLAFSQEDVQASKDYVLFASCETNDQGVVTVVHSDWETPSPSVCTESNTTTIFNVVPTDIEGYYTDAKDSSAEYTVFTTGSTFLVTFTSYAILRTACPEVKPHVLYQLLVDDSAIAEAGGTINDVDYGVVALTHYQFCDMKQVCGVDGSDESSLWWARLLSDKSRSEEDILREAWRGQGNLWAFVRPDKFPISEALSVGELTKFEVKSSTNGPLDYTSTAPFAQLPLDILLRICELLSVKALLSLFSVNRIVRGRLLPHVDQISYISMTLHEPFYFPAQPIETKTAGRDREEVQQWEDQWARGGIYIDDLRRKAPWMQYRMACSRSMSMWNRKRIWGLAKQIEQLARSKGLIERSTAGF